MELYCTSHYTLNDFFFFLFISELFYAQMTRRVIGSNMCFELGPKRNLYGDFTKFVGTTQKRLRYGWGNE
jgi:hypothetical protein